MAPVSWSRTLVTEAPRAESFEISASGPMFGSRMKQPAGAVLALEQEILAHEGLCPDDFDPGGGLRVEGERRPLRVPLETAACRVENNLLIVEFSLPRGSYATSVVTGDHQGLLNLYYVRQTHRKSRQSPAFSRYDL